jgi:1,5-anhydro-D-fructose reductase (1,5-anhydro-D-mannitol-forming)
MIRFGIAGFGLHAVKRLMPGFQRASRCRVVALSRRDLGQAQASARQFQIEHAFASTADLCANPEVDAVLVASPDALHCADVLTAVQYRKPVLCEKPMAMNAAEAGTMVEAARKAGVMLGVAHVMRFEESVRLFRDRIASGAIGRPQVARADFLAPMLTTARAWVHDSKLAAGGPLSDIGVHCIDTLRFVLSDVVRAVLARAHYDSHSPLEANATAVLEFDRGTLATVTVSARGPYRTFLEVAGDIGVLSCQYALTIERPIVVELRRGFEVVESREVSNADAYAAQVDAFAAAVEEGRDFEIPGEQGLKNQLILDAAFRSIKSGKLESVN